MSIVARRPAGALVILLALGVTQFSCAAPPDAARVHRLAEMNTEQIRALDRARTVILIPGGIMEEHGPYLPSYLTGFKTSDTRPISLPPSHVVPAGLLSSFHPSRWA